MNVWVLLRILAFLASIGFIVVGLAFIVMPQAITGEPIGGESALWHALSLGFMATVTVLGLMVLLNPKKYWIMLMPLGLGKAASSITSLYWYTTYQKSFLLLNTIVDGAIAIIALILYIVIALRKETSL